MNHREGRSGVVSSKGATGVLGVLAIAIGALLQPGVADATTPFNGSYTAVQPDLTGIWIVSSTCGLPGCVATVVRQEEGFTMLFDGTQWNRLAVPRIGTCRGASVPARAAALVLVPQSDGTLVGTVTSTVDCDGATVDTSLPLTVTPL